MAHVVLQRILSQCRVVVVTAFCATAATFASGCAPSQQGSDGNDVQTRPAPLSQDDDRPKSSPYGPQVSTENQSAKQRSNNANRLQDWAKDSFFVGDMLVRETKGVWGKTGTAQVDAIFTDITLELGKAVVRRELEPSQTQLVVRVIGGVIGDTALNVSHGVEVEPGDHIVAFVGKKNGSNIFVGGSSAVLKIKDGHVFTHDGEPVNKIVGAGFGVERPEKPAPELIPIGNSRPVRSLAKKNVSQQLTLDESLATIEQLIQGGH